MAQEEEEVRIRGLRIGYDVSRLALYILEPERTAFELSADMEVKLNYYITTELGMQQYRSEDSLFTYHADGFYGRIGMDYNILKKRAANQYEMVFAGIRYGYSRLDHDAENIYIRDNYWNPVVQTQMETAVIHAHWIEAAAGVRAELFRNIFIGWSFRWRIMLYQTRVPEMKPIYIPGYGRGEKKSLIGFNYYIYVRIPLGQFKN
jgi:hypothetical protein